jgi:hypothetical protein
MITALVLPLSSSLYPSPVDRDGAADAPPFETDRMIASYLKAVANRSSQTMKAQPDGGAGETLPWLDGNLRLPRATIIKILQSMYQKLDGGPIDSGRLRMLRERIEAMSDRIAHDSLDRTECKALIALMGKIGKLSFDQHDFSGRGLFLRDLCQGLRAVGKASAIQLKLEQEIARREQKYTMFQRPGAYQSNGATIHAGGTLGVPHAVSLSLGCAFGKTRLVATDDIINVQDIHQASFKAQAKAAVGTDIGLGADIQGSAEYTRGPLYEWGTANERAAIKAMEKVNQARGIGRLVNGLKPLTQALGVKVKPVLGRYDAAMQRADRYRDTLPMLISALGIRLQPTAWNAPAYPTLRPLRATLTTVKASGQLNASWLAGSAGMSGTVSRAHISAAVKTDFATYLDSDTRTSEQDMQRVHALAKRAERLWSADEANSPKLRLLTEQSPGRPAGRTLEERLAHFEAEIDQFEHMARYQDLNPHVPAAAAIETSFASSWLAASREEVLIHMLDAHAWLKSRAIASGEMSSVSSLKEAFARTASKLYNMRVRHDSKHVFESTSVVDQLTQKIKSETVSLNVGAGLDFCGAGFRGGLTHIRRDDPNPLREGRYIDVELAFSATASPGALIAAVLDSLQGKIDASMFADVSTYLGMHTSDIGVGARVQIRFFRPRYQSDPDFGEKARGYHFQTARFFRDTNGSLGAQAPLPLIGGVAVDAGLQIQRANSSHVRELFGNNTLSGPMLRYMRLLDTPDADARWRAFCQEQKDSLVGLMEALGDRKSDVAQEAAYWSGKRLGTNQDHPIFAQMKTFRQGFSHVSTAIEQLSAFFGDLQEPFNTMKRASPYLAPQPLL